MSLTHQEAAPDLTDGDLMSALVAISEKVAGPESGQFGVERFSDRIQPQMSIRATREDVSHRLFEYDDINVGSLRTIMTCTLRIARPHDSPGDASTIRFSRDPKPNVEFTTPNDSGTQLFIRIIVAAQEQGLVVPRAEKSAAAHDDTITRALAEQVALLRDLVNKQAKANEQVRERLEYDYTARVESLRNDYDSQLAAVRQDHEAWAAELRKRAAEKELELENRGKELAERETKLDLQSERDARRSLRRQIQDAAAKMFEKPELSEDARRSFERVARACRWTIGVAIILLGIAFFGPPTLEMGGKVLSSDTIWLIWSMRVLAGVTLATTLVYYIRSLSAWSRQVAAIELRSKQFALDVDRASWLVEMALEYEKEGKTLPPTMVESFTRGLFEGGAQAAQHEAPSASLLHLIQNAESLKVGAAGAELTISGRQIRKADAQASKSS